MINMNRILIETYLVFSSSLFLDKKFVKIRKPFLFNLIFLKKYKCKDIFISLINLCNSLLH